MLSIFPPRAGSVQAPPREWRGLQHPPHLSWEKALGSGPRLEEVPCAAPGTLLRMPVHRPPPGPLQHFLTQPRRTLQGTSVHPVQRRCRQALLHVSLGRRYTQTPAGQLPAPALAGSPGLDFPGDHPVPSPATSIPAGARPGRGCGRRPLPLPAPSPW
jgi:hypothetical protein